MRKTWKIKARGWGLLKARNLIGEPNIGKKSVIIIPRNDVAGIVFPTSSAREREKRLKKDGRNREKRVYRIDGS